MEKKRTSPPAHVWAVQFQVRRNRLANRSGKE